MALNIVKDIDSRVAVKNVLMSVSDKSGLETFVPALVKACPGVKIYSTGGTYVKVKEILGAEADKTLVAVSDYTGQPEMQGGLVKTLDFKRASAKNYLRVASVTDPLDYGNIATELEAHGGTIGLDTRFRLMKKAFAHTAAYDTAISQFFASRTWDEVNSTYDQH